MNPQMLRNYTRWFAEEGVIMTYNDTAVTLTARETGNSVTVPNDWHAVNAALERVEEANASQMLNTVEYPRTEQ